MRRFFQPELIVNVIAGDIGINWGVVLDVFAATLELGLTLATVALGMAVAAVLVP